MAAIIEVISQPGQTLYAVIHNSSGQLWSTTGVSFENFNSAHWANYVISLTEQSPTGYYTAAFPSSVGAGKCTEVFYAGSGATSDPVIGNSQIYWNGTSEEQGIGQVFLNQTLNELGSVPAATPTIGQALMMLYMSIRNSHSATAIQEVIKNDAGTIIGTALLSDDGTTTTKGKFN